VQDVSFLVETYGVRLVLGDGDGVDPIVRERLLNFVRKTKASASFTRRQFQEAALSSGGTRQLVSALSRWRVDDKPYVVEGIEHERQYRFLQTQWPDEASSIAMQGPCIRLRGAIEEFFELTRTGGAPNTSDYRLAESVRQRVGLPSPKRERRSPLGEETVTMMFTDIESSTVIAEKLRDQHWLGVLRAHNEVIREQLRAHDGREVDTAGDGFMAAFSSARQAVRCAIATQRAIEARFADVRVRIGIHTGDAVKNAEKFVGRHVHVAARVSSHAVGGEILISSVTAELIKGEDFSLGAFRPVELKGLEGVTEVGAVQWRENATQA